MALKEVLSIVSALIILAPLLLGVWVYAHLGKLSKIMLLLVVMATFPQIVAIVNKVHPFVWKGFVYNIYTVLEFGVIIYFLWFLFIPKFKKSITRNLHLWLLVSCGIYVVFVCYFFGQQNPQTYFLKKLVFCNNFIYVFWILLYFYLQLIKNEDAFKTDEPEFWYVTAYLLYSSMSALYFILTPDVYKSTLTNSVVGMVQNCSNIMLYIFISIGFYKESKVRNDGN